MRVQHERISTDAGPITRADTGNDERVDQVVDAVETLRRAEAHLVRRRQSGDGPSDIDRTALRHIIALSVQDEPATPKGLAALLGISTASTTALIDRLVRDGLVSTQPHPVDRRKKLLIPTLGTENPDDIGTLAGAIREIAADLSDTEAQLLIGALTRITRAVDDEQAR